MNTVPLLILLILSAAAWLSCAYVAFSRKTLRTVVRLGEPRAEGRKQVWAWRYPHWRNWALVGLVLIPIVVILVVLTSPPRQEGEETQIAGPTPRVSPSFTPEAPIATETSSVMEATETASMLSTEAQHATQTVTMPTLTWTATSTLTPTPTASPTPTVRPTITETLPTPSPTLVAQAATWTPSPTPTAVLTATAAPTTLPIITAALSPTALPVVPQLALPLLGREYTNPITFRWHGALRADQYYQVTAVHQLTGYAIQSPALVSEGWQVDLPAERFGEWRWQVLVMSLGQVEARSPQWAFWFNPFPGTRQPTSTPTPTGTPVSKTHS
jgi:hypothetical protein